MTLTEAQKVSEQLLVTANYPYLDASEVALMRLAALAISELVGRLEVSRQAVKEHLDKEPR